MSETYKRFILRSAFAYAQEEAGRLMRQGVHGRPLYEITEDGSISVNVIQRATEDRYNINAMALKAGDLKFVAKIEFDKQVTEIYSDGDHYYTDGLFPFEEPTVASMLRDVDADARLGVFAAMLHSVRSHDVFVLSDSHPAHATGCHSTDKEATVDETAEFEPWHCHDVSGWRFLNGRLLRRCDTPYFSVLSNDNPNAPIEIIANIAPKRDYDATMGLFRIDQWAEARGFASQLVENGFGNCVREHCVVTTDFIPPTMINHSYAFDWAYKTLNRHPFVERHTPFNEFHGAIGTAKRDFETAFGEWELCYNPLNVDLIGQALFRWRDASIQLQQAIESGAKVESQFASDVCRMKRVLDCLVFGAGGPLAVSETRLIRDVRDYKASGGGFTAEADGDE
jgi:hypothetical protein